MYQRNIAKMILAYHKCESGTWTQREIRTAAGILLASKVYLLVAKKKKKKANTKSSHANEENNQSVKTL